MEVTERQMYLIALCLFPCSRQQPPLEGQLPTAGEWRGNTSLKHGNHLLDDHITVPGGGRLCLHLSNCTGDRD